MPPARLTAWQRAPAARCPTPTGRVCEVAQRLEQALEARPGHVGLNHHLIDAHGVAQARSGQGRRAEADAMRSTLEHDWPEADAPLLASN